MYLEILFLSIHSFLTVQPKSVIPWKHHSPVKNIIKLEYLHACGYSIAEQYPIVQLFSLSRQCWHFKSPDTSGMNDDKDWRLRALKHATVLKRDIAILQTIIIYHHIQHNLFWTVSQTSVLNYHWHVLISLTQHATQFIKVNYSRRGRAKLPRAKTWKIRKNIRSIFGNIHATYFRVVTIAIYTIYKHNHEHIISHYHYHCFHCHLLSKLL